jgi:TPR repeat protein
MITISGWAEDNKTELYSAELVKKAETGDATAQYRLGQCYQKGIGVAKDEKKAFEWYKKSAEQGNAVGQGYLGLCFYNGQGVAQDHKESVKWFTKAAEQGYA